MMVGIKNGIFDTFEGKWERSITRQGFEKTKAVILFVVWFKVYCFLKGEYNDADEELLDVHDINNFDDEVGQDDRFLWEIDIFVDITSSRWNITAFFIQMRTQK